MIAALFVETNGCYFELPDVDPWDAQRDARLYRGPWPVVAHPPCQRWGRFWHGSPVKPHVFRLGDDNGCFYSALRSLLTYGGILEHPAYSKAWDVFGLPKPNYKGGWTVKGSIATCYVEQGHYGHMARKGTWLMTCGVTNLPDLIWGPSPQRLSPIGLERYGYEKARRAGIMGYVGGKDKAKIRARTPMQFRDLLISFAKSTYRRHTHVLEA